MANASQACTALITYYIRRIKNWLWKEMMFDQYLLFHITHAPVHTFPTGTNILDHCVVWMESWISLDKFCPATCPIPAVRNGMRASIQATSGRRIRMYIKDSAPKSPWVERVAPPPTLPGHTWESSLVLHHNSHQELINFHSRVLCVFVFQSCSSGVKWPKWGLVANRGTGFKELHKRRRVSTELPW